MTTVYEALALAQEALEWLTDSTKPPPSKPFTETLAAVREARSRTITAEEARVVQSMRDKGYAVAVLLPYKLGASDSEQVESAMTEAGYLSTFSMDASE